MARSDRSRSGPRMMYEFVSPETLLTQGDLLWECPLTGFEKNNLQAEPLWILSQAKERVLVLTQACDIANGKTTRLLVAVVHGVESVVASGKISRSAIRDQIRLHRVFGLYFLPESKNGQFPESIVDLRDLHTIPLALLEQLAAQGHRVRLTTPYREHLAQHFAVTYSRIALPEPYQTK